jgi:hypothetical protein
MRNEFVAHNDGGSVGDIWDKKIFREFRNHVWIQATRDPKKVWLNMKYCVTRGEVDSIIKDWPAQW